ncbi:hypothetical protein IAU60_003227 [Kwoniella sp. DSM 27419]
MRKVSLGNVFLNIETFAPSEEFGGRSLTALNDMISLGELSDHPIYTVAQNEIEQSDDAGLSTHFQSRLQLVKADIDLESAFRGTVSQFEEDLRQGRATIVQDRQAAMEALRYLYLAKTGGRGSNFATNSSFDLASSLLSRLLGRVERHFGANAGAREVHRKLLALVYTAVVLALNLRTPGLVGI